MNSYKYTLFLISLFIFFTSANSLIRQVTNDFDTQWQRAEEAGAVGEVYNGGMNVMNTEIGFRDHPPSSYSLKMESFTTIFNSVPNHPNERYESLPFTVGGFNWTLIVYPKGNKNENGTGFISMYVEIDKSTLKAPDQQVNADLTFYIYNNIENNYFTLQDKNVWRFNVSKTMLGYSQVIAIDTFTDPNNGYLYDVDHCQFGVDVIISQLYQKSELLSFTQYFETPIFTWSIQSFSTLSNSFYLSDDFPMAEKTWNLKMYPNGHGVDEGKYLSLYLIINERDKLKLKPKETVYVLVKLRVLNQGQFDNVDKIFDFWYSVGRPMYGYDKMISLPNLRDLDKGFLVNDVLILQIEFHLVSKTTYFPNPNSHLQKAN